MKVFGFLFIFSLVTSTTVFSETNGYHATHIKMSENYESSIQRQIEYLKQEIRNMEKELIKLALDYAHKSGRSNLSEYTREIRGGMVQEVGRPFSFVVNEYAKLKFNGNKLESIVFETRKSRLQAEYEPITTLRECVGTISENDFSIKMRYATLQPEYQKGEHTVELKQIQDPETQISLLKHYKNSLRDILFQIELLAFSKTNKTNAGIIQRIKILD